MGGIIRAATSLPKMIFRDSAGTPAPQPVQDVGNATMSGLGKMIAGTGSVQGEIDKLGLESEDKGIDMNKKKKGRYDTLLTGRGASLGSPDIKKKSLLGG